MAAALVVVLGGLGAGAALAETAEARTTIKVMDRNLYLGTDPILLALSPNKEQFRKDASRLWRQAKRTEFPERSKLIAKEIDARDPALIGLQEVALWRRSDPGEADDDATRSTNVKFDFLKILQRSLRERGERYRVAVKQREANVEAPTNKGFDVRLTMHDVILVRRESRVRITGTHSDNFNQNLGAPTAYGREELTRGWTAADVELRGARFRFVNTHLEAYSGGIGEAQAQELTRRRGALATNKQTILLGDLNSDPKGTPETAAPYRVIRQDGFRDAWLKTHPNKPGFTYGFNSELIGSPEDEFDERIDHILFRNGVRVKSMSRFGLDPRNRTAEGRWPSDHAGLVARFSLREGKGG